MHWRQWLAALAVLSCPSLAEDCKPLSLNASVPLTPRSDNQANYVPVEVAGTHQMFLLDTGSFFTMITSKAADELKLHRYPAPVIAFSATGNTSQEYVVAPFAIGTLQGSALHFIVTPSFATDHLWSGILGADLLSKFDVSIDFGAHRLDLIDPNHCEGKAVYWPERPIAVLPFRLTDSNHIIVEIDIDGKKFKALLDTGATDSTLNQFPAKHAFGIAIGDATTPLDGKLNGDEKLDMGRHRFKTLTLEGLQISNPDFMIIPDAITPHLPTGETMKDEAIIGMNVLKHLHIYIAYKEKKLYITPAAKPAETPAK